MTHGPVPSVQLMDPRPGSWRHYSGQFVRFNHLEGGDERGPAARRWLSGGGAASRPGPFQVASARPDAGLQGNCCCRGTLLTNEL